MSYTPGPHRQYGRFVSDTADTLGGMYAIRTSREAGSDFLGAAVRQEDATLWAAATKMHSALTALAHLIDQMNGHDEVVRALTKAGLNVGAAQRLAHAKAAIAEATGAKP